MKPQKQKKHKKPTTTDQKWAAKDIHRGDLVRPRYSTFAICTSEPYTDPKEWAKQRAYWKEKHKYNLPEEGQLVKVMFLLVDEAGKITIKTEKEYIFPLSAIRFKNLKNKFPRMIEERKARAAQGETVEEAGKVGE